DRAYSPVSHRFPTRRSADLGDDLTVLERGTGVEHLAVELGGGVQAFDDVTLGVVARVAASGDHHAHGRARVPGRLDLVQGLGQRGLDQQHQGGFQAQHHRLGLRVAEAAVELDDFRLAGLVDHQPGVEEAGVDVAFGRHAAHGRVDHLVHHALVHVRGDDRSRRVGAHATGVGAGVAVADALVILAGGHR